MGSHWPKHKKICDVDRLKIDKDGSVNKNHSKDSMQQEVVLVTINGQGLLTPLILHSTEVHERFTSRLQQVDIEPHRKRYQKKRENRRNKEWRKFRKKMYGINT